MKGTHLRNRVSRKLTNSLFEHRLHVREWTPFDAAVYEAFPAFVEPIYAAMDALAQWATAPATKAWVEKVQASLEKHDA